MSSIVSSSSFQTPVLNQHTYHLLSESGEHISIRDGWQTIRCVALSQSSSSDSEGSVEVPTFLESLETLEFLGFTPEAGRMILARFENALDLVEDPCIFDYAKGHIRSMPDVGCLEDDWNSAILAMGITQTMCDKILDPEFSDIRLTQNARYWVIDTIEAKFLFLTSLNTNVLGSKVSDQGPVSLQARLERSKKSSSASSQPQKYKAEREPQPQILASAVPQAISDTELVLLKGGDCGRLQKAIRVGTDLKDVNRIENVRTIPPGDFAGIAVGLYFTKQRQVAYRYASYARNRFLTDGEDPIAVGILQVVIPRELTAGSVDIYGAKWQEFVWNHRLQHPTPDHLRWIEKAPMVIGPVSTCSPDKFMRLVHDGMDYRALEPLRLAGGESVTQYFLKEADLMRKINEQGRFQIETLSYLSAKAK
jgi:hypothetical protein